jgi:hypothetical protein
MRDRNAEHDDDQRDRPVRKEPFAQREHDERAETERQRRTVRLVQVRDEVMAAFPEIAVRSGKTK